MKVFAISDLHLSSSVEKPMDVFGMGWDNHFAKISEDWQSKVGDEDLVLIGGDISWGMNIREAAADYALIQALPGHKLIGKGNHDYYWSSLNKMRGAFEGILFLQNNAYRIEKDGSFACYAAARKNPCPESAYDAGIVVAGSRGWNIPDANSDAHDVAIYKHELARLELSLSSAAKLKREKDVLIALLHFPPFDATYASSEVTALLERYNVNQAIYGHLHGKGVRVTHTLEKNGIIYRLTSCDLVNNKLTFVTEI